MQVLSCRKSKNAQDTKEIPFEALCFKNAGMACGAGRSEMTSHGQSWTALLHCDEEQPMVRGQGPRGPVPCSQQMSENWGKAVFVWSFHLPSTELRLKEPEMERATG